MNYQFVSSNPVCIVHVYGVVVDYVDNIVHVYGVVVDYVDNIVHVYDVVVDYVDNMTIVYNSCLNFICNSSRLYCQLIKCGNSFRILLLLRLLLLTQFHINTIMHLRH